MAKERGHALSDLQLAVLRVLWERGESTVATVQAGLEPDRTLAITTVGTVLSRLAARGVVAKRTEGRQLVYTADVEERDVRRDLVGQLMDRLFAGDASALVNHLIHEGEIDADELAALRRRVASEKRKKAARRKGDRRGR